MTLEVMGWRAWQWCLVLPPRPPPGLIFLITHIPPCVWHVTAWWALLLPPLILWGLDTLIHVCVHVKSLSRVRLFVTPWTVVRQAPLCMGFSREAYWSGFPFPSPGDLPDSGIEPVSLSSPALAGGFFTTSATWAAPVVHTYLLIYIHTYVRPVLYMCVRMHARVCSIASSHRFLRPPGVHTCASYTGSS